VEEVMPGLSLSMIVSADALTANRLQQTTSVMHATQMPYVFFVLMMSIPPGFLKIVK
jgi:hypothetical protein